MQAMPVIEFSIGKRTTIGLRINVCGREETLDLTKARALRDAINNMVRLMERMAADNGYVP